jgi:hypothetical protein
VAVEEEEEEADDGQEGAGEDGDDRPAADGHALAAVAVAADLLGVLQVTVITR